MSMKAIGIKTSLPIDHEDSFQLFELDIPKPKGRSLLVKIDAVSVNPVDTKIRKNSAKDQVLDEPKILGWDAVGTVEEVGAETELFKPGDRVCYAGDITKPGSNAEYQLVDERIVGRAPENLTTEEIAAMPLTTLTAWEIFFDRMRISKEKDQGKSLLIIGGAGGVGSIAIQLASKIAGLKVIASASRPETSSWCKELGADVVVNHYNLLEDVRNTGYEHVDYIADFVDNNGYWDQMVELIKPQGHIASITGSSEPVALTKLKTKSISFSWEFMYTRPMFETADMIAQHKILNSVGALLDDGTLVSTHKETIQGLSVESFREAHRKIESGKTIGKIVISY